MLVFVIKDPKKYIKIEAASEGMVKASSWKIELKRGNSFWLLKSRMDFKKKFIHFPGKYGGLYLSLYFNPSYNKTTAHHKHYTGSLIIHTEGGGGFWWILLWYKSIKDDIPFLKALGIYCKIICQKNYTFAKNIYCHNKLLSKKYK